MKVDAAVWAFLMLAVNTILYIVLSIALVIHGAYLPAVVWGALAVFNFFAARAVWVQSK